MQEMNKLGLHVLDLVNRSSKSLDHTLPYVLNAYKDVLPKYEAYQTWWNHNQKDDPVPLCLCLQ